MAASGVVAVDVHVVALRLGEIDIAPAPDATLGQGVSLPGSRLLGRVIGRNGDHATVRLPMNVVAHVGDVVRLEPGRGGSGVDVFPPRPEGLSVAGEIQIGPGFHGGGGFIFGGIGSDGVQTVSSAEIVYRVPRVPLAFRATLAHAALTFASPSNIAAVDVTAGASFDRREFEVGLSAGGMSYNEGSAATTAFVFEPLLRLGAVDGISLTMTMQAAFISGYTSGPSFNATGVFGVLSLPVGDRFWLLKRIGFSLDGYAHIDGAVRMLVRGNGTHGSLFLLASAGAVATYFSATDQMLAGPSFGIGFEVRP